MEDILARESLILIYHFFICKSPRHLKSPSQELQKRHLEEISEKEKTIAKLKKWVMGLKMFSILCKGVLPPPPT